MTQSHGETPGKSWTRRLLPAAVIAVLLCAAWLSGALDYLSLANLIRHRATMLAFVADHYLAALAAYMATYALLVAISFPGASLLTVIAGFLFGGLVGGILTLFAATAGAAVIFLVARSSFGGFLAARAGPFLSRMLDGFHKDAFAYLLTIRLTPVFPFWVVNIVPALLDMRFSHYVLATFLGIIPGTFAYAFVGGGLGSVIAAQEAANPGCGAAGTCNIDPSGLVTPQVIVAMVALAVISILPVAVRKIRSARADAGDDGPRH